VRGFTLIEVMAVTAMILILAGGSVAAYLNFNKNQSMDSDARSLISEIYRVRNLASSMQYPAGCTSLKGYNIKSDVGLTGLLLSVSCDPDNVIFPVVEVLSVSVFTNAIDLSFLPGSGYLANGVDQQITIKNSNDTAVTKIITVGQYGNIMSN